jgi:hypothetical protein
MDAHDHPHESPAEVTWRATEAILGVALLGLGGVLTLSGILAYIGLPMMAIGVILLLRAWPGSQSAAQ